ncbi:MATE family efflux transporter [Epibacterium sp. SM1979]|uniref:MATE family efflux transporter n=1 Tax=Tritonibacter litoralis TaxID=2662264 RepID=A0A843YJJ2_9RHOB|nr:MATE family efflux transporter [Tritonibacter litoralis]MQQ09978.1 MATE family efflux transporter [Tritonibacter litoralis]
MARTDQVTFKPVSHRRVLKIALPVVVSNATVPLLGVVDTGVVGQLGDAAALAAVAVGSVILTSLYWIFGFLRMGTVGLASQAIGRGDTPEVAAILTRCLLIGIGAGLVITLLQVPLFSLALSLAAPSDSASEMARSYLGIRVWSAPAMIAIYGLSGWLIAQERTFSFFAVQVVMNLLNMVLDIWFVLGLDWGVNGVAMATFIAEWSGFALGLWFCRDAFQSPRWRAWARVLDAARLKHMAMVNSDILIRSLLLQAIFSSFIFLAARQGDVTLAANQVLLQLMFVTAYGMDGFAFAAETLVGQALGAQQRAALRQSVKITSFWGFVVVAAMAAAFALWGAVFIDTMTTSGDVRSVAREFLPYIVAAPILGWASWMLDGIFIGATASRDMRNMMILSAAIYVAAGLILTPVFGNHGLWLALLISFVARGVTLGLRYPALEARAGPALS